MATAPDRNLGLDLVRVTEAAAVASAAWIGRGDSDSADRAAVDAMRAMLATTDMNGTVVIGEGEKDRAPMLFNGERVGRGTGADVDIAVDPLEGTSLCAGGQPNAISIIAVANAGSMYFPPAHYMDKIVSGPEAAGVLELDAPMSENIARVAKAREKRISDMSVYLLDRPRHTDLVAAVRATGARVHLLPAGDTAPAIAAAGIGVGDVDMVVGVGGSPEAVIVAAAMKCLGGTIHARLWPRDDTERRRLLDSGHDPEAILTTDDLVGGDDVFVAATGITPGQLLDGVTHSARRVRTDSLVMRSRSGTWRRFRAEHDITKHALLSGRGAHR